MSPELSAVPAMRPVNSSDGAAVGGLRAETSTAASRPNTLVRLAKTPTQAPKQLDDALSLFC